MTEADAFWQDLLNFIHDGRVIPVIGEGVVSCGTPPSDPTAGPGDSLLYPRMAVLLAQRLGIEADRLPAQPTLNDVACEWLAGGHESSRLYKELGDIGEALDGPAWMPGATLRAIASIPKFNLFLTTTFDPLLQRAVVAARPGVPCSVGAYFPNKDAEEKDLPVRKKHLRGNAVYHLFGEVSRFEGEYVAWEDDTLEFICALHRDLSAQEPKLLARDLKDNALLVLGLNFSDLLVHLFLRVATQVRLSALPLHVTLAEPTPGFARRGRVLLFGGVMKKVHVREQDPRDFVLELARRWAEAYPGNPPDSTAGAAGDDMPKGAIFVSYAREDEEFVRRFCAALTESGCAVWYDRERLRPGGYWPESLRDAVSRDCSVFIAIVSATTESESQGYWRRERDWAIERAPDFYPAEFYIPVWIDGVQPPFRGGNPRRCATR